MRRGKEVTLEEKAAADPKSSEDKRQERGAEPWSEAGGWSPESLLIGLFQDGEALSFSSSSPSPCPCRLPRGRSGPRLLLALFLLLLSFVVAWLPVLSLGVLRDQGPHFPVPSLDVSPRVAAHLLSSCQPRNPTVDVVLVVSPSSPQASGEPVSGVLRMLCLLMPSNLNSLLDCRPS